MARGPEPVYAAPMRVIGPAVGALVAALALAVPAGAASPDLVVSQVYGGGGNAGATYTNDFVELFNRGPSAVSVGGWSVQYASAAGTTWQVTSLPGVTVQPGSRLLVQMAQGAGGTTPLPTPDVSGAVAMSATSGKVALVASTTACTGAGCVAGAPVDFVGYGTANAFEGGAAAGVLSNTTAALRKVAGCTDTDDNGADFDIGAPLPRNSLTPVSPCPTAPVVADCGPGALSLAAGTGGSLPLSASDADGVVTGIAAEVAPAPAAGSIAVAGLVPAAAPGGTATAQLLVSADVPPGSYAVTVTAVNANTVPEQDTCGVSVVVAAPSPPPGDGAAPPPAPLSTPAPPAAAQPPTAPAVARRCKVPRLTGLTLKRAASRLRAAGCRLGRVKKPKRGRTGLVVRSQTRRAGTKVAAGAKVGVTLGPKPKRKRR